MSGKGKTGHYSRRRNDSRHSGSLQRNLDWGKQPNDVELHAQSPLYLSELLASQGSKIRLTPSSIDQLGDAELLEQAYSENSGKVTSIRSALAHKDKSDTSNLLTLHTPEKLRERCKQISVQCALIKQPGEKRLYLAAGIVNWTANDKDNTNLHSPLLFYPVQLISEENAESTSGFVHTLQIDCEIPEFNYQLASEMLSVRGITLPVYNARQTLKEFMARIEECVSDIDDIKLDYRVALGLCGAPAGITTAAHHEAQVLAKLPKHFEPQLAKNLISDLAVEQLQTTLNLLSASNDFSLAEGADIEEWPETPDITEVRQYSLLLSQHGLGKVQFQNLPDLPEQIVDWIEYVQPVLNSDLLDSRLQQRDIKAVHLMKLAGIIELIDKAPEAMDRHVHKDLAYRGTPLLFKRAKYQARLIEDELQQLREHFYLDRVPPKPQLLQLLDELGSGDHNAIEIVDSDYFHARRRFMELSIEKPATLNEEHKRQLNQLVKVLRFRELFVNNTEYRLALGPAYRGLRTDWDALEILINYAQELADVVSSETIAANALADWTEFKKSYVDGLDELQRAGVGIRNLMQIVKPSDHHTSAAELLIKARWLSDQLNNWNMDYGLMTNYGDKTADSVLNIFSGKSTLDEESEQHVRNANDKIQNYLMNNKDDESILRINATLTWLSDAITGELANLEEIESIIQRASELSAEGHAQN